MTLFLSGPAAWAQQEFGFAHLGDRRRTQRWVNIATHLAAKPGGTLPQAFGDWAELKAADRFFQQEGVGFERIQTPHWERSRDAWAQAPVLGLWAVEVKVVPVPEGVKAPLPWVRLTSLPCRTLTQVNRVVRRHTARGWIEEYHQALKTGVGVEQSQLERAERLEALIAVSAVVAVR